MRLVAVKSPVSTKCRLQTADCRLQTGYKMQTRYKMQTADCRLGTKCRLTFETVFFFHIITGCFERLFRIVLKGLKI